MLICREYTEVETLNFSSVGDKTRSKRTILMPGVVEFPSVSKKKKNSTAKLVCIIESLQRHDLSGRKTVVSRMLQHGLFIGTKIKRSNMKEVRLKISCTFGESGYSNKSAKIEKMPVLLYVRFEISRNHRVNKVTISQWSE